jgi:hypothetical protein
VNSHTDCTLGEIGEEKMGSVDISSL